MSEEILESLLTKKNIESENAIEELIKLLKHTSSNEEFLNSGIFN